MSEFEVTREEDEAFNALGKQVAGNHYKDLPIQPVDRCGRGRPPGKTPHPHVGRASGSAVLC